MKQDLLYKTFKLESNMKKKRKIIIIYEIKVLKN